MKALRTTLILKLVFLYQLGYSQNYSKIDSIVNYFITTHGIKGIGIVATENGKITYLEAKGIANPNSEFTDSTQVYIASNTKAFIALCIAKMAFSNQLKYSDPITRYIAGKYFTDSIDADNTTIRDLLNHTHGLSNDPLTFRTAYSGEYPADLQQLLKFTVYRDDRLSKKFKYSNLGYLMAGMIIENVSGKKWQEYLETEILSPLGMRATGTAMNFNPDLEILPYTFKNNEPLLKSRKSENTLHAAGGIYSTLPDMGKWLGLFTSGTQQIVNPLIIKQYLNGTASVEEREAGGLVYSKTYGNGWIFGDLMNKKSIYYSFGRFNGYESVMSFDPASKKGVYVYVNERVGGVYVAAVLSSYFYFVSEADPRSDELIDPILGIIKKVYSSPIDQLSKIFHYKDSHDLTGIYKSNEYGTLMLDKTAEGYIFQLGKMRSIGYAGKTENEIIVEWTPGIREHLFILTGDGKIKIQYGDFDIFERL